MAKRNLQYNFMALKINNKIDLFDIFFYFSIMYWHIAYKVMMLPLSAPKKKSKKKVWLRSTKYSGTRSTVLLTLHIIHK